MQLKSNFLTLCPEIWVTTGTFTAPHKHNLCGDTPGLLPTVSRFDSVWFCLVKCTHTAQVCRYMACMIYCYKGAKQQLNRCAVLSMLVLIYFSLWWNIIEPEADIIEPEADNLKLCDGLHVTLTAKKLSSMWNVSHHAVCISEHTSHRTIIMELSLPQLAYWPYTDHTLSKPETQPCTPI